MGSIAGGILDGEVIQSGYERDAIILVDHTYIVDGHICRVTNIKSVGVLRLRRGAAYCRQVQIRIGDSRALTSDAVKYALGAFEP